LAFLGAIIAEYAVLGVVRAQLDADATYFSRYSYLSGMFALLAIASLIGRPARPARPALATAAVAILLAIGTLSMLWNVRLLAAGREIFAERADLTRAMVELGLSADLPAGVDPKLSLVLVPSPDRLHDIVERFGQPLTDSIAGGAVSPITDSARVEAIERATHPPQWLLDQPWLP
jgi:hypothetical protein